MKLALVLSVSLSCVAAASALVLPECAQNFECLAVFEPVCGTNGVTYSNSCELKKAQCKDSTIAKKSDGSCTADDKPVTTTPGATTAAPPATTTASPPSSTTETPTTSVPPMGSTGGDDQGEGSASGAGDNVETDSPSMSTASPSSTTTAPVPAPTTSAAAAALPVVSVSALVLSATIAALQ